MDPAPLKRITISVDSSELSQTFLDISVSVDEPSKADYKRIHRYSPSHSMLLLVASLLAESAVRLPLATPHRAVVCMNAASLPNLGEDESYLEEFARRALGRAIESYSIEPPSTETSVFDIWTPDLSLATAGRRWEASLVRTLRRTSNNPRLLKVRRNRRATRLPMHDMNS